MTKPFIVQAANNASPNTFNQLDYDPKRNTKEEITVETSSEYLRLALPLLSRYRIPVTPQNFTVWFDYVAGRSIALCKMIDALIEKEVPFNADVTHDLYERFDGDSAQLEFIAAQERVEQILSVLFASLSKADDEALRFEQSLTKCCSEPSEDISVDQLGEIVSTLVKDTQQMNDCSHLLRDHLVESNKEAGDLRSELE